MAENVDYKVEGGKLVIRVDISAARLKAAPESSSGKTRLVATTRGPVAVDGSKTPLSFSLNVMTPARAA